MHQFMVIALSFVFLLLYVYMCLLSCRATSSGQSDIANLTVIIEDVNDETPVISGTTTIEIDEELDVGTVIEADITATDADAEDAVLTYSLRGTLLS